jgi:membrane-associated phospholipid phosphatase
MSFIKSFLGKNKDYLLYYFFLIIVIAPILFTFSKTTIHLAINKYHCPLADIFFKYITHFGDGIVPVVIAVILLFYSNRNAILVIISCNLAGLLVQFFKQLLFEDIERPIKYLSDYQLHLVDGIQMYSNYSFPSGHSASIFALCFSLAILASSMLKKIVLFCIAVLVAFSRVYLSQHFLIDVYAGSIIGIVSVIIVAYFINKLKGEWLDKSLPEVIKHHQ